MIKLYDGELSDILPNRFNGIEQQCISYALKKQIQYVIDKSEVTKTQCEVDKMPDKVLDIMASELRAPYYRENLNIEKKREIVKNTLTWHYKAGTPSAVEELISVVFGEGKVVEWFDFKDPPYTPGTFDIVTNAQMTEDALTRFMEIIERVKNERSHIRGILIDRMINRNDYTGTITTSHPITHVFNDKKTNRSEEMRERIGIVVNECPETSVFNWKNGDDETKEKQRSAAVIISDPIENITNLIGPKISGMHKYNGIAIGARAAPESGITNNAALREVRAGGIYNCGCVALEIPVTGITNTVISGFDVKSKAEHIAFSALSSPEVTIYKEG